MLLPHQKRAVNEYIISKQHSKFDWGTNDCHTFVAECHDRAFGTYSVFKFKGKYDSPLSAVRYQRKQLKTKDWLADHGYTCVTDQLIHSDETPEDGDVIILQTHEGYMSAAYVIDGVAHSLNVIADYYTIDDPRDVYEFNRRIAINIQQEEFGINIAELWRKSWA